MRPHSAAFSAAVKTSHHIIQKVDLYRAGKKVIEGLPVLSGSWSDDKTADIRMCCSLDLEPTWELIPDADWHKDAGLWPVGNEIQLWAGLRFPGGKEELLACGRYRIGSPVVQDNGEDLTLGIEGFDRSRAISRNRFIKPYAVKKDQPYSEAIQTLIWNRLPTLTDREFIFMPTLGMQTPTLIFQQTDDPWQMAVMMAESCGAEILFDGEGRCVLRPERPIDSTPDWDYSEGEISNLLGVGRDLDDDQGYNGVIVDSNHSDLKMPIHAEYWDADPQSPMYFDPRKPKDSIYGAVPYFMQSEFITSRNQAEEAARNNFYRVGGITENIKFNAVLHPGHESGDIVRVKRTRAGVDSMYALDALSFSFGVDGIMQASCRQKTIKGSQNNAR